MIDNHYFALSMLKAQSVPNARLKKTKMKNMTAGSFKVDGDIPVLYKLVNRLKEKLNCMPVEALAVEGIFMD